MKNFLRSSLFACIAFFSQSTSAADSYSAGGNYLGILNDDLRTGNISFASIPIAIISVTKFLLSLTGTIAVAVIIYGALRIVLWAVPGDKDSGKKLISAAIIGFVISVSGWTIINIFVSNL